MKAQVREAFRAEEAVRSTVPDEVPDDVLGLDETATLAFVVERRRRADAEAAMELRAVAHWADLHAVEPWAPVGLRAMAAGSRSLLGESASVDGAEGVLRLAGEGAFGVHAFSVCELAAALGLSEASARSLVGEALELRDRLPRLWARVLTGDLAVWRARRIAAETIPLPAAAAAYVDAHLAGFAHRIGPAALARAVAAAILRHAPELAAAETEASGQRRGVWLDEGLGGTTLVQATLDSPDAAAFDQALNDVAAVLRSLGDTDSRDVRRARAVGVLADPQHALDLQTVVAADGAAPEVPRSGRVLHVHLHTDAVSGAGGDHDCEPTDPGRAARVEPAGQGIPAVIDVDAVRRWIAGLSAGAVVKVTPVVDLADRIAVDAYEVPDRLRTQVEHRDLSCRFPWCGRRGRWDADHIEAWVPPEEGGRRGQTSTDNLARLCRFHHRVKTHHPGWDYQRTGPTSLRWTSPLGRTYTVDETGTHAQSLPRADHGLSRAHEHESGECLAEDLGQKGQRGRVDPW